jgi:hypothetical protein
MVMMKENSRSPEAVLTHLIIYILSASCMPTIARHFLTVGKLKHFQAQDKDFETEPAVRSTNFLSARRKGAESEFMQMRPSGASLVKDKTLCRASTKTHLAWQWVSISRRTD